MGRAADRTMLSIFSAPKPFVDPHIATIQRNAIGSWLALGPQVEVLLIGDEPGIAEAAVELGARHLGPVERNAKGTPLISAIFERAQQAATYPLMAYFNTDIIVVEEFLPSIRIVAERFGRFMIVGQRWDFDLATRLESTAGWTDHLRARLKQEGRIHPPAGSDYFVFPRGMFHDLPPFALGRAGWDNWMIFAGRRRGAPVVDATDSITVIHQSHDYRHLEGGTPHYRLPESLENVRLGGGRETVFTLADATWRLANGELKQVRWPGDTIGRWIEAGIIVRLGPGRRLRLVRPLAHPVEFLRSRVGEALRRVRGTIGASEGAR